MKRIFNGFRLGGILTLGAALVGAPSVSGVTYVTADGTGDGTSWTNAMNWANALLAATNTSSASEIWVTGDITATNGVVYAFTGPLTIRGGFAGTESSPSQRPSGARSVVDGLDTYNCLQFENSSAAPVTLDSLYFTRGYKYGVRKDPSYGSLAVTNCAFNLNGSAGGTWSQYGITSQNPNYLLTEQCGCGASFSAQGSATLAIVNCEFCGNTTHNGMYDTGSGGGACVAGFAQVTMDSCLFATNHVRTRYRSGYASALQIYNTPARVRNCAFRGNAAPMFHGCVVNVYGNSGGTSFENCLFTGNLAGMRYGDGTRHAAEGQIHFNLTAGQKASVANCTFAYNYARQSATLNVQSGAVDVRNSILWANVTESPENWAAVKKLSTVTTNGTAICCAANGTATADWILMGGTNEQYVSSATAGAVTLGEHVFTYDPRLVTPTTDFANLMKVTDWPYTGWTSGGLDSLCFDPSRAAYDVHLNGVYVDELTGALMQTGSRSRAVDAGDPDTDFANEPSPNGGRVNLGCYGNTPWATQTSSRGAAAVRLAGGSFTLADGAAIRNWSVAEFAPAAVCDSAASTITISGGGISNCWSETAGDGAGAISLTTSGTTLNLTGGTIVNNSHTGDAANGGGIWAADGTTINVSGAPTVKDNQCGDEGKSCDVHPANAGVIRLAGTIETNAYIGVDYPAESGISAFSAFGAVADGASDATGAETFHHNKKAGWVGLKSGGSLVWAVDLDEAPVRFSATGEKDTWTGAPDILSAYRQLASGGIIEINRDIDGKSASAQVVCDADRAVVLRSNSDDAAEGKTYTLTCGGIAAFTVGAGSVTVSNLTVDANGQALNVFEVTGGTLTLGEGGRLVNAAATPARTGVKLTGGAFVMNGGAIDSYETDSSGHPVEVAGGVFTLTAGKITNCARANGEGYPGGAVYVTAGTMNFASGEITGNSAAWGSDACGYGGGILVSGGSLAFTGGTPVVSNNVCGAMKGDIATAGSATAIALAGNLTADASVGVSQPISVESIVSGTTPFGTASSSYENANKFFYTAAPSVLCGGVSDGKLVWQAGDEPTRYCVRWSTDDGANWHYVTSLKAAFDAITVSSAAIVEIGCDLEYRFESDYALTDKNITLRSNTAQADCVARLSRARAAAITVPAGASLTVTNLEIFAGQDLAASVFATTGGALTLGTGAVVEGAADYPVEASCLAVGGSGATLALAGGTVRNWNAAGECGVVAYTSAGGAVTVSAGAITDCTVAKGAVVMFAADGALAMSGGRIADCAVTLDASMPYAVYGGVIAGAKDVASHVTVSGGEIANNAVARNAENGNVSGSAICLRGGSLTLTGGVITNNTQATAGRLAGVWAADSVAVNVSGTPVVGYNANAGDGQNYGICVHDTDQIAQTDALGEAAWVGVSFPLTLADDYRFGTAASELGNANRFYYTLGAGLFGQYDSGTLVWNANSDSTPVRYKATEAEANWTAAMTLESAVAALTDGGIIEIHGTVDFGSAASAFASGKTFVLRSYSGETDPGLATLNRTAANALTVPATATLTVSNLVLDARGTAADLFAVAGALTLGEGAKLTNSGDAVAASAVGVSGTLNVAGGYVDGWQAKGAAAVCVEGSGRVALTAGGVINSSSTARTADYGAIYATGANAVALSGAPVVTNNYAAGGNADLVATAANVITLADDLTAAASVGVLYPADVPSDGTVFGVATSGKTVAQGALFYATTPTVTGGVDGENLVWGVPGEDGNFIVRHKAVVGDGDWTYDVSVPAAIAAIAEGAGAYYVEIGCDQALTLTNNLVLGNRAIILRSSSSTNAVFTLTRGGSKYVDLKVDYPSASLTVTNVVVDGGGAANDARLFTVAGGTLNLAAGGTIRNVVRTQSGVADAAGAAVLLSGKQAKFVMTGGAITGCSNASTDAKWSGIVTVGCDTAGAFEMSGGTISGNAGYLSSAVLVNGGGTDALATFAMTGGRITGNRTTAQTAVRAAVYAVANAQVAVTGGKITENVGEASVSTVGAKVRNYGAYAAEGTATLTFGGKAFVRDNRAAGAGTAQANVYAGANAETKYQIRYDGFAVGAAVGVSNDTGDIGETFGTVASSAADRTNAKYFFYDDAYASDALKLTVGEVSGGVVVWALRPNPWTDLPVWMCDIVFPALKFTGEDLYGTIQAAFTNVWDRTGVEPVKLEPGTHFTVDEVHATELGTYATTLYGVDGSGYCDETNVSFTVAGEWVRNDGTTNEVAVAKAWRDANLPEGKTLEDKGANGFAYWQSYVLGLTPETRVYGDWQQTADPDTFTVLFANYSVNAMPGNANMAVTNFMRKAEAVAGPWTGVAATVTTNEAGQVIYEIPPATGGTYYRLGFGFSSKSATK